MSERKLGNHLAGISPLTLTFTLTLNPNTNTNPNPNPRHAGAPRTVMGEVEGALGEVPEFDKVTVTVTVTPNETVTVTQTVTVTVNLTVIATVALMRFEKCLSLTR